MGRIARSAFKPAWWAPGPHLQTLWPSLTRRRPRVDLDERRIELRDGDFIDLAIGKHPGPQVLVLHGLEGNLDSHYAGNLVEALDAAGFQPVFMHLRGCSREPNRLDRAYHSGASEDLAEVLTVLNADGGQAPFAAVGFSLGANLLLKYLGETEHPLLSGAVAVSVPFVLRDAMLRLDIGVSRIYRGYLMRKLKASLRRKAAVHPLPLEIDFERIADFNTFDDQVTAPLNGFAGVFDYYSRASCRQLLPRIQTRTLILQSADDPFMFPTTLPWAHELGPGVTLEISRRGGHVGFVSGTLPWRPVYWLEQRIMAFLKDMQASP